MMPPSKSRRNVGSKKKAWRDIDEPLNLNEGIHSPSEFIAEILRQVGLSEGIEENRLKEAWKEIVGDYISSYSRPVSLKKNILTLQVSQPAMKFHLEQMRGELLTKLQKFFGKDVIKIIRFTVG
jgi:hypothetical protein